MAKYFTEHGLIFFHKPEATENKPENKTFSHITLPV